MTKSNSAYEDKVVFITGAASGMGQALAIELVRLGARVIATDLNTAGLEDTAQKINHQGGQVTTQVLDVTNNIEFEHQLQQAKQEFGSLDYVFNNAGIAIIGEIRDMSRSDWDRLIEVNQTGVLNGTLAAYKIMLDQGSGHIINTASIAGLVPTPLLTAYSMTKHAVVGLTLSLREEAKALGIKASVVCPGIVRTDLVDGQYSRGFSAFNPFTLFEQKSPFKAVTSENAARIILKAVARNQAKIVFPASAKIGVNTGLLFTRLSSLFTQKLINYFRQNFRGN